MMTDDDVHDVHDVDDAYDDDDDDDELRWRWWWRPFQWWLQNLAYR